MDLPRKASLRNAKNERSDTVPSMTTPLLRRRRTRGSDHATRSPDAALLASTGDLNFSVLGIEDSFERLTNEQRLRLYYITKGIQEAQKLSFLQSSRESPAILLLFQELFSSADEELSPGELILELQRTCFAKGLTDAVSKFFKYAIQFYHNSGNYELLTGAKILPELARFEFQEVVLSSRAFAQHRGLRLQRAMDACLEDIYSSGDRQSTSSTTKPTNIENPGLIPEATIVAMNDKLTHPFYGLGVSYMDAVRVDRTLDKHDILKINTRIVKVVDNESDAPHATFHVVQTSLSAEKKAQSGSEPHKQTSETLMMANQDQIQLMTRDYGSFLSKMAAFLKLASRSEAGTAPQLVEKTVELFTVPSMASFKALHHAWLVHGGQGDGFGVDFLLSYSRLPSHRDPLGTRGALEGFVTVRNEFYQQRIDRIVRAEGVIESTFLRVLPFHQLMTASRPKLEKLNVACVDLVFSSRSASLLPVVSNLDVEDKQSIDNEKILFIANSTESYTDGQLTGEKQYLLDGLLSSENAKIVRDEWDRVVFLRFVVEEVVAPRTRVVLKGDRRGVSPECGGQTIALLPADLLVESSDEEEFTIEDDSEVDEENEERFAPGELLDAPTREALLLQSSYAKRPTQWYSHDPGDTYQAQFYERLATVLEECRVVLAGLLLALNGNVRQTVCGGWYQEDAEANATPVHSSKDSLNDVALACVLLVLRDGLLALPFFATQQFRWEDDKMMARHMVLQMLLEGEPEVLDSAQRLRPAASNPNAVVCVKAREEKVNRDITQLALGVDEIRVRSLEVQVQTEPLETPNQRTRSWRHRLKIQVRGWLQHIQWIQMTGDIASGQRLYEHFSLVSDEGLRYRNFLLLQLGDPDTTRKAADAAAGGSRRTSTTTSGAHWVQSGSPSSEPLPTIPTPSLEVRNKLLGIRNPSHFSRDTIWIPPLLQLKELPADTNTVPQAKKRVISSTKTFDGNAVNTPEVNDVTREVECEDDSLGNTHSHDGDSVSGGAKQVELRRLPAGLSYAIEAAVLSIGVISDKETVAFKTPK